MKIKQDVTPGIRKIRNIRVNEAGYYPGNQGNQKYPCKCSRILPQELGKPKKFVYYAKYEDKEKLKISATVGICGKIYVIIARTGV